MDWNEVHIARGGIGVLLNLSCGGVAGPKIFGTHSSKILTTPLIEHMKNQEW